MPSPADIQSAPESEKVAGLRDHVERAADSLTTAADAAISQLQQDSDQLDLLLEKGPYVRPNCHDVRQER